MVSQVQVGEIYIVRVPFAGGGGSKPRPVLITGAPNSKGDVLGVEIDQSIQHKLLITVAPDGYLRRMR